MLQFSKSNQFEMLNGNAPFSIPSEQVGGRQRFEIHHIDFIRNGGKVYDMDNMRINTVKNHLKQHSNK